MSCSEHESRIRGTWAELKGFIERATASVHCLRSERHPFLNQRKVFGVVMMPRSDDLPSPLRAANVICACLAVILIFLICIIISKNVIAAGSAALIFAITPIFAVWGLETSAEPLSNGYISLVLWFCLRYVAAPPECSSQWRTFLMWCALTSTLVFSLTVKRENILLPVVVPVTVFFLRFTRTRRDSFLIKRQWYLLLSAIVAILFSFQLHLSQTQSSEIDLLKQFPLTTVELISFLPIFVSSFLNIQWYWGTAILVLAGIFAASRRRSLELIPLSLFAGYVVVYAFHLRSYYEMQSGTTNARAALRFSMSLMSIWSILAGLGAAFLIGWFRRTRRYAGHETLANWLSSLVLVVIVGASFFTTLNFRDDVVEDEFRVRVEPSLAAAKNGTPKTYVITLEPLILQMYGEPTLNLINLHSLNDAVIENIGFYRGMSDLLYLDEQIYRNPVDAERYLNQLTCLNQFRRRTLVDEPAYAVIRLSKGTADEPHPQFSTRR